jgi:DinB superfamily
MVLGECQQDFNLEFLAARLLFWLSPKRHTCIYVGMANLTEFSLAEAIAVLTRTPATLNAILRGLPNIWVRGNEGKDTWNAYDIVGHLIVAERTDWMPRVRIILESGEARAFDPFDRFAQMRMKEMRMKQSQGKPPDIDQLLDDFAGLRRENLAALQALNLQPEDLARRGRHPALGVVTLGQLLATWAVHDLTHVHQLSRVMAHQYRDAVGPWSVYLGVLKCDGHSDG